MTDADALCSLVAMRQEFAGCLCPDMLDFHKNHPSIFFKGAFIFRDGSIWVAR